MKNQRKNLWEDKGTARNQPRTAYLWWKEVDPSCSFGLTLYP